MYLTRANGDKPSLPYSEASFTWHDGNDCECHTIGVVNDKILRPTSQPSHRWRCLLRFTRRSIWLQGYGLWGRPPKHTAHALGSIRTAGVPTYAVPHLEPKTLFYSFCHDLWLLRKLPTTLSRLATIRFNTENVEGAAGPHRLTIIKRSRQKK